MAHLPASRDGARAEGLLKTRVRTMIYVRFTLYTVLPYPGFQNTTWCVSHGGELATKVTKGGAQVVWIRNLRATCCSQFDSNTYSEAQASEVSTVRILCHARIFEILKSRKMVIVYVPGRASP